MRFLSRELMRGEGASALSCGSEEVICTGIRGAANRMVVYEECTLWLGGVQMSQRFLILFISLLCAVPGPATTYYVSVHGADTNDGLSAGTPFAHHPWDSLATDTADATTLRPGDIVYMKRGHIWYNCSLNVEDSGNSGNP